MKVLAHLNPDLKSLAEDTDFSKAAPLLFGAGFQKQAKECSEAFSCLRKATSYAPKKEDSSYQKLFFRGACSLWKGSRGSGSYNSSEGSYYHKGVQFSAEERLKEEKLQTMNVQLCMSTPVMYKQRIL